jgi:hypothetical protein
MIPFKAAVLKGIFGAELQVLHVGVLYIVHNWILCYSLLDLFLVETKET